MKKWTVIIILACAQFVMILDSTVMNVSISTVAKDLGTTISGMQAAITFYALTMASLMLTGGKLGDIWGRHRAFKIGSVIYGVGSLMTALSPSLAVLLFGWSLVEGLGAVLVIPAIAALAAVNYKGKDRVVAFSILGAVTGLAAAVGPIIGGFVTTYLSWRYVFAAETVVMAGVLLVSGKIQDMPVKRKPRLDFPSVILSASGLGLVVLGVLQSKTWGWFNPLAVPSIGSVDIAPFGISVVAYLILAGGLILNVFYRRQKLLEQQNRYPLLKVSLLNISVLRSGLGVFMSQYFVIAALFFVVPVYLQTILGYDALGTGLKLLPLSVGLVLFSAVGSRMTSRQATRRIVRIGQLALALGSLLMLGAIDPELRSVIFWAGMFVVGSGFGLLASQLGNVNMSAVPQSDTAEVGGLQGTFQNLGTSFGTALVGSVFMLTLTSGFVSAINSSSSLPPQVKSRISESSGTGVAIIAPAHAEQLVLKNGGTQQEADTVSQIYEDTQLQSLRDGLFLIVVIAMLSLVLSRSLPAARPTARP
jgi:MFS family permease